MKTKIEGRERECKYLNIIRRWDKIELSSNDSSFRCRSELYNLKMGK